MPDFAKLAVLRTGVMGLMTADRAEQINRSMFAGLSAFGHVEVRLPDLWNARTLELNGQLRIPADGEYAFMVKTATGQAELLSGQAFFGASKASQTRTTSGNLKAGVYPFTIKYYNQGVFNVLNIQVKGPGMEAFQPFESLVVPITEWQREAGLTILDSETKFVDASAIVTLSYHKPVKASGESQGANVPANIVDGNIDNESGCHFGLSPQWLQVDLEKVYAVNRIKVHTYADNSRSYQYTVEGSTDEKTWSTLVDESANKKVSTAEGDNHTFAPVKMRYVRINLLKNSANPGVHLNELLVFEAK